MKLVVDHHGVANQLAIAVLFEDEQRIKAVYDGLSAGGNVLMPLQPTFGSPAYAMVRDRFGVTWYLSLEASR